MDTKQMVLKPLLNTCAQKSNAACIPLTKIKISSKSRTAKKLIHTANFRRWLSWTGSCHKSYSDPSSLLKTEYRKRQIDIRQERILPALYSYSI